MAEENSEDETLKGIIPYMGNYDSEEEILRSLEDEINTKSTEEGKESTKEIKETEETQDKSLEELVLSNKTERKDQEDKEYKDNKKKPVIKEDIVYKPLSANQLTNFRYQMQLVQQNKQTDKDESANKALSSSVTQLAKIMEGVQQMVTTLAEVSKNNVEAERLRLQYLEAQKQKSKEVNKPNPDHSCEPIEDKDKKRKSENPTEIVNTKRSERSEQNSLNKDVELLKKVVGNEFLSNKINIKREYKLSQKSNFDLWMDYLRSDLTSNDLLDVIDPKVPGPDNISETNSLKRKNLVRDIIINHLDENYHKKILNESNPREILKKLKGHRKSEVNVTHTSVRARLYQIKMRKDEKVNDFCERFDSIIREYEGCEEAVPLTEQEMRSSFYQAVTAINPELRNADLIRRQTTSKEMNLDEIKSFILQLEAEKKNDIKEEPKAQRAFPKQTSNSENRCHRCNKLGHWAKECNLNSTDKWFCYFCQEIKNHKGNECPQAGAKFKGRRNFNKPDYRSNFKKNTYKNSNESNHKNENKNKTDQKGFNRVDKRGRVNKFRNTNLGNAKRTTGGKDKEQKESGESKLDVIQSIDFIADSGATDHIVNNKITLRDFKRCENEVIKSANKKDIADIQVDGKGDLLLIPSSLESRTIKLTNVIAAKDISDNLLSLRKLADTGLSIYLDDEILRVYNKTTNETVLRGKYEKPNWIIKCRVKEDNDNNNEKLEVEEHSCKITIVSEAELPRQSQTSIEDKDFKSSEGEVKEVKNASTVIGRENEEKLIELTKDEEINIDRADTIEWANNSMSTETIKIDNLEEVQNMEEEFKIKPFESKPQKLEKLDEAMLWHFRLGHASLNYLKKLQKTVKSLEKVKFNESILECEVCVMAKMEKLPFRETRTRSERPLQVIHTDTMGPIKPTSYPGQKRFINVFIDDYSRLAKAYPLKTKDESGKALEEFLISTRNLLGKNEKVCYVKSDQGTEFTGKKFLEILQQEKIEIELTPPYTPEHNGVAERFNATIQRKVRAYMFDSGLPKSMWELAVDAAVHAYNRTPHKSIEYESPLKKFAPNANCHFDKIKRFGCIGYIKIPKPNSKFAERAIKAVLVGYKPTGYLLWHPSSRKFLESRHVRFNEKRVYKDVYKKEKEENTPEAKEDKEENDWNWMKEFEEEKQQETRKEETEPRKRGRPRKSTREKNKQETVEEQEKNKIPLRRSKRKLEAENHSKSLYVGKLIEDISYTNNTRESVDTQNSRMEDNQEKQMRENESIYCFIAAVNKDPTTYKEAMQTREKEKWQDAVKEELKSMTDNEVWVLIDKSEIITDGKKANIIDSKWVFKRKIEVDGSVRFKARLVTRGFKDNNAYDITETYAPVSRLPVIRSILAIINKYDLQVYQLDVKTAFLNGVIEEEIYMDIPEGLEVDEHTQRNKVCKLKRALYGLKISPKKWNKRFTEEVRKIGLENDLHEPCLYTWRKEGRMVVLVLYVDDILLAGNDEGKLDEIKEHLNKVFEMKNLGEPKSFLSMEIQRNREEKYIIINQPRYTESILEKFHMKECNPQSTPMVTRQVSNRNKRRKLEDPENKKDDKTKKAPYREAIGSLMYLANATRPDISFAVNYLARKQLEPTEDDWMDVKRIFRYLKSTVNLGLKFQAENEKLEAFTDASFRDHDDSTSTSGYIIRLFGDIIAWRSHKQISVTLSTCQAEYLAMSEACTELISLDKAIRHVIGKTLYPAIIWCDNRAASDCTKKDGSHKLKMFDDSLEEIQESLRKREQSGTRKHMAESHGDYIKECVHQNKIRVEWIATKENLADCMTKPLPLDAHKYLRDKMMT